MPRFFRLLRWPGWRTRVRYALDRFEVPYELIYKERVKKGDLKSAYDVIVHLPHVSEATFDAGALDASPAEVRKILG